MPAALLFLVALYGIAVFNCTMLGWSRKMCLCPYGLTFTLRFGGVFRVSWNVSAWRPGWPLQVVVSLLNNLG